MIFFAWRPTGQRLTPNQQAVRDRLQEGGSAGELLLILGGVAAAVLLVYLLAQLQRGMEQRKRTSDPKRLFTVLLGKLKLTAAQRELLATIGRDLELKDPAVILLSPALFDRHVEQWWARRLRSGVVESTGPRQELVDQIRRVLFPDPQPVLQ